MAKPISFGQYQFKTKKACEEEARKRINSYCPGSIIAPVDKTFFEALFTLHSEYDEKIGCGIKDIEVGLDFHRNRCLSIIRRDNSKVVISWRHCVKPHTRKMVVSYAYRRAIKDTVMAFKDSAISNGAVCPILGTQLVYDNSHVSYSAISFDDLLSGFLIANNLSYETIELVDPDFNDSDQRGKLRDQAITESWQKYHQSKASFELLSAEANLSK
ncbi:MULTISPECIES: DCL family protein [unclassified Shewanella]|uniref:DCL family protein n=1 Tax=unclassified Shewanella TaxID=196818 RepID=UPI0012FE996E|nr:MULTISPECIES: DCL family protein [unclassified Shewanella]